MPEIKMSDAALNEMETLFRDAAGEIPVKADLNTGSSSAAGLNEFKAQMTAIGKVFTSYQKLLVADTQALRNAAETLRQSDETAAIAFDGD